MDTGLWLLLGTDTYRAELGVPSGQPSYQWQAEQSSVVAELGCCRHASVYGGFQKSFTFLAALHVVLFVLGSVVHYFLLVLVSGRHFVCLGVACGVQGIGFVGRLLPRRLLEEFRRFSLAR